MKTAKLGAIFLVSIMALAGVGVGVAHWSEYLWLQGEVYTGELCLEWSCELYDNGYKEGYGDVGEVDWGFVDEDGDGCPEGLWIYVGNAYPSLEIWGTIDIHNCGTIPAAFYDIVYFDYYSDPEGWPCECIDFEYEFSGDCSQIDPCEAIYLDFWLHFEQCTPENAYAEFYIELEFVNWNEA